MKQTKTIIRIVGILIFSVFVLLPLKTYAADPEWSQNLDLTDSISSAIAKVEDGIVVMQYEGTASSDNLLIKYDLNGNKVWEIDNNYGYYISSVSDGFIVWTETKITKFDKDKNVIWTKKVETDDVHLYLGDKLVELNNEYIIGGNTCNNRYNLTKFDKDGNMTVRKSYNDIVVDGWGRMPEYFTIYTIGKTLDNNSFILVGREVWTGIDNVNISIMSSDLEVIKNYSTSVLEYEDEANKMFGNGNKFNNIIETNNGYLLTGAKSITFKKDGTINKIYSRSLVDPIQIGDYTYAYLLKKVNSGISSSNNYEAYIVKYDEDFKEVGKMNLNNRLYISSSNLNVNDYGLSGMTHMKNRVAYYQDNNELKIATIIGQMSFCYNSGYGNKGIGNFGYNTDGINQLVSYRYNDTASGDKDDDDGIGGTLNSIIKNPETNSIIIISAFVVLVLVIATVSYIIYHKKMKKKNII